MNYLFFNPSAKNGKAAEDLQLIKKTLDGQDVEIYAVTDIDDYVSVIDKIQPEDIVYIVGGDGTLNRFINDSTNLRILGDIFFYSAGTGNDFKHDVDPDNSLYRIRLNDYIRNLPTVTVGGVTYKFINGIGFGIDGYCCETGDKLREENLKRKYPKPINYTKIAIGGLLFHYKPKNATVTVDGKSFEFKKVWLATVMNGRYYGGGMMAAPDQDRNRQDGKVSVVVFHNVGKLLALLIFPSIFSGQHTKYKKHMTILEGNSFDRPTPLQIDGETVSDVTGYSVRSQEAELCDLPEQELVAV